VEPAAQEAGGKLWAAEKINDHLRRSFADMIQMAKRKKRQQYGERNLFRA
jgi:hypothetical protein